MNRSNKLSAQELKELVLNSFIAEKNMDIQAGLKSVDEEFKVTEMVASKDGNHLPSLSGKKLRDLMKLAFKTEGRQYTFKSVLADEESQTVIVEFIETYPDPKSGQIYRTPQISVCSIKNGKIFRTRHYMDPRLSFENLTESQIESSFQ